MPVISTVLTEVEQRDNRKSIQIKFDTDYKSVVKHYLISNAINSTDFAQSKEQEILNQLIEQDGNEAIEKGIDGQHKHATTKQVYRAYLIKSLTIDEPLQVYLILSKIAQKVQDLGLTMAQLSVQLEVDIETVQNALTRWQYLKANQAAILTYQTIKDGM